MSTSSSYIPYKESELRVQNIRKKSLYSIKLDISGTHAELMNVLRRTMINDIPHVVLRCGWNLPGEDRCKLLVNRTQLDDQLMRKRISQIPLIFDEKTMSNIQDIQCLELVLDVENNGNEMRIVTTDDMYINEYASAESTEEPIRWDRHRTQSIFPSFVSTRGGEVVPIHFIPLKPQIPSVNLPGEAIHFRVRLDIGTSKEHRNFGSVYTCTTFATPVPADDPRYTKELSRKQKEWRKEGNFEQEGKAMESYLKEREKNWKNHDAQRITIPHTYTLNMSVIPTRTCFSFVTKACQLVVDRLNLVLKRTVDEVYPIQSVPHATNGMCIWRLVQEDVGFGNMLSKHIFAQFYPNELSFCTCSKTHDHGVVLFIARKDESHCTQTWTIETIIEPTIRRIQEIFQKIHSTLE